MSSDRKTVRVTIFNQPYTLLASEEPGEVEALAQIVDEIMTNIASRAGNVDSLRAAVLTSLHLADQLRSVERDLAALKDRVGKKSQELSILLDDAVR
jgi:cell division protein ZapA (FtsZ GTPase activity inhibitor)